MKTLQEHLSEQDGSRYQSAFADLIRSMKPLVVVETGVCGGNSTFHILKALDDCGSGHLHSIDPNTTLQFEHPRWTLWKERSETAMGKVFKQTGAWDVFLHDSDHRFDCQTYEYGFAYRALRKGGILATDDHEWDWPPHGAWKSLLKTSRCKEHALGTVRYIVKGEKK